MNQAAMSSNINFVGYVFITFCWTHAFITLKYAVVGLVGCIENV